MKYSIYYLLGIILFSSCSPKLTSFNQKLYENQNWNEEELKKIQFYLSDNIVLRRKAENGVTEIKNGKIKTINGEKVEEIVFKRGTPGVYLFSPKEERFAISFEEGDEQKYLIFGPNPKMGNRYTLFGKEWSRNSGSVTYQEKEYYTSSESAYTTLLVDLRRRKNIEKETHVVKGRRLD
ncbi:MAG TPA: hypothetical protein PK006_04730 [Saprospiraceae bacterium]|nr:hypothetical protein [Saprospiraceae bacterium]